MTTVLQISIQIRHVPGQGRVGVTPVCIIVVLHAKTLLLKNLLLFDYNLNFMTMIYELLLVYCLFSANLPYCTICS